MAVIFALFEELVGLKSFREPFRLSQSNRLPFSLSSRESWPCSESESPARNCLLQPTWKFSFFLSNKEKSKQHFAFQDNEIIQSPMELLQTLLSFNLLLVRADDRVFRVSFKVGGMMVSSLFKILLFFRPKLPA
jgi:hypothetical protein